MTAFRFFALSICFIFAAIYLQAQSNKNQIITGQVFDSKTKKPIPHAEIFISGTTSGCISDSLGNFVLRVPFFPCTLVADHVAYESFVKPLINNNTELKIELSPSNFEINEVSITGKNKRRKNLRFFYSQFLLNTKKKIEIPNDSVLYLSRSNKEFIAYTNEPLIIINHELGYKIKLTIKRFSVIKSEYPNGPQIPLKSVIGTNYIRSTGYYYYEPLETNSPNKIVEYQQNRRTHYLGSLRHFMKSIYSNTHQQEGFTLNIYPNNRKLEGVKSVKHFDNGTAGRKYIIDCDSIKVTYTFGKGRYPYTYTMLEKSNNFNSELTTIYRSNYIFTLFENGISPDFDFVVSGKMANINFIANSLPQDYSPF